MFKDKLSRFSKARKIKWPSFLLTKGSTLLKRKSTILFALYEWKLGLTHRIKEILSFVEVMQFSMRCCSSLISFIEQYWHNLRSSGILGVQYLPYSIINLWLLVPNCCHCALVICVFYKVQVMRFLVVLFEKRVKF